MMARNWKKKALPTLLGLTLACGLTPSAKAVGTWTTVSNAPPEAIGLMLQLTDGRVMAQGLQDNTWYALTPDATGSYANGTWSQLASMKTQRLFFTSQVLRNGDVLIAGGEYSDAGGGGFKSNFTNLCEVYHTQTNTWTDAPIPKHRDGSIWSGIGDGVAITLQSGLVMLGDVGGPDQALYDYTTNTWTPSAHDKAVRSDEESWALLPDNSVLTVDDIDQSLTGPNPAERYVPTTDSWVSAGQTPDGHNLVEQASSEIGPGMLLPSGSVLFTGASGHTALYSTTTSSWVGGPDLYGLDSTTLLAQKDAPGCVEVNGKVLLLAAPDSGNVADSYPSGQHFLEYTFDSTASNGSLAEAPTPSIADGYVQDNAAYLGRMLQLPNGQVLFTNTYAVPMFVYTPDSGPDPAWLPTVTSVTAQAGGTYLVKGTQFNGLSMGANYGDDVQVASNYPLVRLTSASGSVYYGRTYNHSTMGVATGSAPVSTTFTLPAALPVANYTLQVIANGIASNGVPFSTITTGPLIIASLTLSSSSVPHGTPVTAVATLSGPAPAHGYLVIAYSGRPTIATIASPYYVTIPAGSTSATFTINTLSSGDVTIQVGHTGSQKAAKLRVN